jgi:Tol biopolymer transport system component
MKQRSILLFLIVFSSIGSNLFAQSQYFGQNKPRYKEFDFKVLQSPHFELYHYFEEKNIANDLMINSEHWYKLHQEVFKLAFIEPNPVIIYKTHPDFQETTAIGGQVGEGTGGVTEGLRNRVIMPMMYTHRQTDHVLSHELVHAFQYKTMTYGSDSTSLASIQNLPLFMVEGLAEYMSLGRDDSHTAMWMRDAVESDDIPSIEDMVTKQYKYFPYRWGQAFWSYVTATYGDDIIRPLFKETALYGIQAAFKRSFSMDIDRFSAKFKQSLIDTYKPLRDGTEIEARGKIMASEETGSEMNVSPTISPNGKLIAYISSKNVLSLDIYIADAATGKTVKRISSNSFAGHVDSYSFIETAGSWSPDSKNLAIVVQSKGKNKLSIIDARSGNKRTYILKGVDAFTNPAWSPDGNSVVVSGLVEGHSDLFQFNLKSREVINLTNDEFSDIQPNWSSDGKYVYFVSDREEGTLRLEKANLTIGRLDMSTKKVESFPIFKGADNLNPVVEPNGENIIFLSDRDGYRNLYKYNIPSGKLIQLTNYYTGVSGITMFSPALSIAAETGDIAYSYFFKGAYSIIKANDKDLLENEVPNEVNKIAGKLAPFEWVEGRDLVQRNLGKQGLVSKTSSSSLVEKKYDAKFKLDYLANSGLGASTSRFGTGVGGGITGLFSDMLSNNQLSGTVALNGEIQDFGGQLFYLNQKRPLQFGASISHIPYRLYGGSNYEIRDSTSFQRLGNLDYYKGKFNQRIIRLFFDELEVFANKPFSKTKRLEFGASMGFYSFGVKDYPSYGMLGFDNNGNRRDFFPDSRVIQQGDNLRPEKISLEEHKLNKYRLGKVYTALVGDNTTFGTVAPLNGYRYRLQIGQNYGSANFTEVKVDLRKYYYLKPVTIAARFNYESRLNAKGLDEIAFLTPLSLTFPWNMHGFNGGGLTIQQSFLSLNGTQLSGNQMALANFEVRLPFTGPERLAIIPFNFVPSDLNLFFDMGTVWDKSQTLNNPEFVSFEDVQNITNPVFSTGISLRVNVLGYVILEPYMAIPFINGKSQPVVTGINFMIPGW